MELKDILKKLRKKSKFTQDQIAEKLGIKRSTYSNYETGLREPDLEMLGRLGKIYEVSISKLVGDEDGHMNELDLDIDLETIDDIIVKYNLKIDGKPMTADEARTLLALVRTSRSLNE